jgi:hypothetical protein
MDDSENDDGWWEKDDSREWSSGGAMRTGRLIGQPPIKTEDKARNCDDSRYRPSAQEAVC